MESLQIGAVVTKHTIDNSFSKKIVNSIVGVNLPVNKTTLLIKNLLQNNIEEFRGLNNLDSKYMIDVDWWSNHITQFCLEAVEKTITTESLLNLITVGFLCTSKCMIENGFNINEIVELISSTLSSGLSETQLQSFLSTNNAINTCGCLKAKWSGASQVGLTIGFALLQQGATSPEQLVTIMDYACQHNWPAENIIKAIQGALIGAPNWRSVLRHLPCFLIHNSGSSAGTGSLGGPTIASHVTTSSLYGGGHTVKVKVTEGRLEHVQNGHTFEFFDFSYENCTRHRYSSFYPAGTNINYMMTPLPRNSHILKLAADTVAWRGFSKTHIGIDVIGVGQYLPYSRAVSRRFYPNTGVTQLYPQTGIKIYQKELVAIGRLFGRI